MVFTKLSTQEKDAFFGLLDEYFQSRPELFGQGSTSQGVSGLAGTGISTTTAASAVQRALAVNAGRSNSGNTLGSNNPYTAALATGHGGTGTGGGSGGGEVAAAMALGRVAAASLAFSQGPSGGASPSLANVNRDANVHPGAPPPSLPRRTSANVPVLAAAEQFATGTPGAEVDKLVSRKASVFSAFKKAPSAGVNIPPAFAPPKNAFGPPPVRRVVSETTSVGDNPTSTSTSVGTRPGGGGGGGARAVQQRAIPLPPPPQQQPEEQEGEWAEVLYDYTSEDPGDLAIEAGTRVFVTAKSSEDWWTGQVEGEGREGLFPASYVKLL